MAVVNQLYHTRTELQCAVRRREKKAAPTCFFSEFKFKSAGWMLENRQDVLM